MERRTITFRQVGLMDPGKEVWGPKRKSNPAYTKKCEELLEQESKEHPRHRVAMSVDHRTKRITFEYYPVDLVFEENVRKVDRIMEKDKLNKAKRFWQGK